MSNSDSISAGRRWTEKFLAFAGVAAVLTITPAAAAHDLMPVPAEIRFASGRLAIAPEFRVALGGIDDIRLADGLGRYLRGIEDRTGLKFPPRSGGGAMAADPAVATLVVNCQAAGEPIPRLGEDESYQLEISNRQAVLTAPTVLGALRGFSTLTQLLQHDDGGWFLPAVSIQDEPRFPWRGLLIDVCRHWEPEEVIKRNLDGMALVKLNVLHLHLTEDQGFRIESKKFPRLQELGSDGHYFTQEQMRGIIAYAADRGIRVVPEFDLPGHATSWVVGYPELASAPGPYAIERHWGVFNPVLDPTNPKVYELLDGFLGEMAALFPDAYIHIGGDENNGVQWNANPKIQAFIREHHLKDNPGLHAYFNGRVHAILAKYGKKLIGWDEILHPDLPAGSVVQSWRGTEGLAEAARRGFATILSHGYYIDLNYPAEAHYLNDPLPADTTLTAEQQKLVLGGEATMWGERVSPDNIDTRIWPRTAAIAERLWSPRDVRDVDDMYRRLAVVDLRLQEAGLLEGKWPRFDLPGVDPQGAMAGALRTLAAVVEPLKDYRRGDFQPEATQATPLNDLADWCRPDSTAARAFNADQHRWLFAPGELDDAQAASLTARLEAWRAAGELAAQAPADASPVAQGRVRTAKTLAALSQTGIEAIQALVTGTPLAPGRRAAAQAILAEAAQPTAAAVEFPSLPAFQVLVAAATEPRLRAELSRDAWRQHLREVISPPAPAATKP
jgi:hexosaminidase